MPQRFDAETTWRASGNGVFQFSSPGNVTLPFGRAYITVRGKGADGSAPFLTPAQALTPSQGINITPAQALTPSQGFTSQPTQAFTPSQGFTPASGVAGQPTTVLGVLFPAGAISQTAQPVAATEINYYNFTVTSNTGTSFPVSVPPTGAASITVEID